MSRGGTPIVVGIDIGTHCGYAALDGKDRVWSGTWELWNSYRDKRDDTPSWVRWSRLMNALENLLDDLRRKFPSRDIVVVVEDVRRHQGTRAAHVYGGLRSLIELKVGRRKLAFADIGVSEWKKLVTGKGNASKEGYVDAANERFGLQLTVKKNEDEAAALGVAEAYRLKDHSDA